MSPFYIRVASNNSKIRKSVKIISLRVAPSVKCLNWRKAGLHNDGEKLAPRAEMANNITFFSLESL